MICVVVTGLYHPGNHTNGCHGCLQYCVPIAKFEGVNLSTIYLCMSLVTSAPDQKAMMLHKKVLIQ